MKKGVRLAIILILLLLTVATSCERHSEVGDRLAAISEMVSDSSRKALILLDSIGYKSLSSKERHYYDFLKLKAQDKAYITHTSDSVILDLIEYYEGHDKEFYPEVLYYGGRVYSDLGDYPTALDYFHQAEDALQDSQKNTQLESRILSQTGRLLNTLRLYEEAIPYIEKAIEINKQNGDYKNVVYNLQLLSQVYYFLNKYDEAELYLKQANTYNNVADNVKVLNDIYLAELYYEKENLDSALKYIKRTLERVNDIDRNTALINAARIYLKKDSIDTAYRYVNEILNGKYNSQKDLAYYLIISSDLKYLYPQDSVNKIYTVYRNLLEDKFNQNCIQLALDRQNIYNYKIHEDKRKKAEKRNVIFIWCLFGTMSIIFIIAIILLIIKNRYKYQFIKLNQSINEINLLKKNLNDLKLQLTIKNEEDKSFNKTNDEEPLHIKMHIKSTIPLLREKLRNKILNLLQENPNPIVNPSLLESDLFFTNKNYLRERKPLKTEDWISIKEIIIKTSPTYLKTLQKLSGRTLTKAEEELALLTRFGLSPNEISILIGRAKNTVSNRRRYFEKNFFGNENSNGKLSKLLLLIP